MNLLSMIFKIFEWVIGISGGSMIVYTYLLTMFADSPSFGKNFTPFQKFLFNHQMDFIGVICFTVIASFVLQFFQKSFPWSHIGALAGVVGFVYTYFFIVAYFSL